MKPMTRGAAGEIASRHRRPEPALLSLEDVTLRRRVDSLHLTVLDGVSVEVLPGELVAVSGDRRAGKTALLRVAAGMEPPQSGVVRVRGRSITGVTGGSRARRARAVGYMPRALRPVQGAHVVDHIALPLLADGVPLMTATARAHEALERVGAASLASAAPHDLDAGDHALMALARALVRRPSLLLADEPGATAGPEERTRILRLLRSLAREHPDMGLLVTTRDATGCAGATRVFELSEGRLVGEASSGRVIPLPVRAR